MVIKLNLEFEKEKSREKALTNYKNSTEQSQSSVPQTRGKYEKIKDEIRAQIIQKVFYEGSMTRKKACNAFSIC